MTGIDHEIQDPVSFAGGVLHPYRHVCAFVNSRDEMHWIFDPFVREGLARGEKLSYVVNAAERANYVRHFRHLGLDLAKLLDQGQLEVRTWSDAHRRGNRFDIEAMLRLLDEILGGSRSPRIRLVSEMGWVVDHQGARDWIEFEARANYLLPNHEHVVICIYDTAKCGGDVLIDVLRTHPMALIGGMLQVNPFFVPAEEFLEELRSRDRRAPNG